MNKKERENDYHKTNLKHNKNELCKMSLLITNASLTTFSLIHNQKERNCSANEKKMNFSHLLLVNSKIESGKLTFNGEFFFQYYPSKYLDAISF